MSVSFWLASREDEAMNVSSRNARVILVGLLGFSPDGVEAGGQLDPHEVLLQLATSDMRIKGLTVPTSEEQSVRISEEGVGLGPKVIDCGVSIDQLERYVKVLRGMAVEAESNSELIYYS